MNIEIIKILAPYFTSILGAIVAIGIAVYNNSSKSQAIQNKLSDVDKESKAIQSKLSEVDVELHGLKDNHFFHLGEYLKKLNAFLYRGRLMDDVEKTEMDCLADGVSGIR
jgi:hypothetical protein